VLYFSTKGKGEGDPLSSLLFSPLFAWPKGDECVFHTSWAVHLAPIDKAVYQATGHTTGERLVIVGISVNAGKLITAGPWLYRVGATSVATHCTEVDRVWHGCLENVSMPFLTWG
jgi:hypothetical protein